MYGRVFRLEKAVLALERVGDKNRAVTVPKGAVIQVERDVLADAGGTGSCMACVQWLDKPLEMFVVDIRERGEEIAVSQFFDRAAKKSASDDRL